MTKILLLLSFCFASLVSCAGGDGAMNNESGTSPVNQGEVLQYKQALHRCYKTGGSRIVKINGYLQCY